LKNIVIFASGGGTNAERIIEYFKNSSRASVKAVFTNNANAYVIERARQHGIPAQVFSRDDFYTGGKVLEMLREIPADLIVLAGFLWLIPEALVRAYPGKIVNIHPALLPAYGGKGMYGARVHQAVIKKGEKQSGISIHYVNEHFDEGEIIFQATCPVEPGDTPEILAGKVQALEHEHFPRIIESLL
jgi:phosphoribosylglycinamide formyltransferase 1